jgi:hypothetical protein
MITGSRVEGIDYGLKISVYIALIIFTLVRRKTLLYLMIVSLTYLALSSLVFDVVAKHTWSDIVILFVLFLAPLLGAMIVGTLAMIIRSGNGDSHERSTR